MHPFSMFPQLFTFGLIAPLLLRLSASFFLVYLGLKRREKIYKWTFIFYIISGILVFLGLYTQPALILGLIVLIFDCHTEQKNSQIPLEQKINYVLIGIVLLSLLFTGPGFFAFDLPL